MSLATFRNLTYTVNVVKWQTCNYALKIKSLVGFNSIFNIDLVSSTCQVVRWAFLIQYLFESICPTICISCKGEFISFGILWSQNIWFSFQLGETSGLSLRKLVPNPALQPQWKSTATVYVQTLIFILLFMTQIPLCPLYAQATDSAHDHPDQCKNLGFLSETTSA